MVATNGELARAETPVWNDPDRPAFHVAPSRGWLNDPNGPIWYKGRYHLFYQHVEKGCEWQWGLVWGHAVSEDLAHWRHLPPMLRPTPGGLDADGCWSGCCGVSREGVPTILYTGVRLRSNKDCRQPPPPDQDQGLPFIESQCAAVPQDPGDDLLLRWRKLPQPVAALPPPGLHLTGWRDPFVYMGARSAADAKSAAPGGRQLGDLGGSKVQVEGQQEQQELEVQQQGYRMLLGCGIKGKGGVLLAYSSKVGSDSKDKGSGGSSDGGSGSSLAEGWQYDGMVCSAADLADSTAELADGGATNCHNGGGTTSGTTESIKIAHVLGQVWECPLLAQLPPPAPEGTAAGSSGDSSSSPDGSSGRPIFTGSSGGAEQLWLLAVSPYPVKPPHTPSNPVLYWVGRMKDAARFDLPAAAGPFQLDHGDVVYAPNVCTDAQGRLLLWAWVEERRPPGTIATYSGCLTLPRLLRTSADGRRLVQQPAPEVALLRRCLEGSSGMGGWHAEGVEVAEGKLLQVEGVAGQKLDIKLCFSRGSASSAGLLILSHEAGSQGNALLTYCWDTNVLEVLFGVPASSTAGSSGSGGRNGGHGTDAGLPPPPAAAAAVAVAAPAELAVEAQLAELAEPLPEAAALEAAVAEESAAAAVGSGAASRRRLRLGGQLAAPAADAAGRVRLRVLIDGSVLEVFTGSGEVLTTRVYRGRPPPSDTAATDGPSCSASGVCVVALGGTAVLESGTAWEMSSCWEEQ